MLGIGGSAPDDGGIDGLLNQATALGLDAVASLDERAAVQVFPNLSKDLLPNYEEILLKAPSPGATEQDRREAVLAGWTLQISAEIPTLNSALKSIDSRFSVLDPSWANSKVTIFGRAFAPYAPGSSIGGAFNLGSDGSKTWTDYPAYSTRDEFSILFDLGAGIVPGIEESRIITIARDLLDSVLPSTSRYWIITALGLIAGVSPVGYTGVSNT